MPEIEVCFGTVFCYITLPVFIRIERAGVNIDVGIKFLDGHFQTSGLKEFSQRGGNDAFTQRRGYASGNKYIFSHKAGLSSSHYCITACFRKTPIRRKYFL